ncbi:MAG: Crp/Fnr family transcriptional regulator [Hyphomicrobiaceae bacterium]|nr:Crp/Fnr family transcriptional regulator [Hyphomicrobiaceae bacterium]
MIDASEAQKVLRKASLFGGLNEAAIASIANFAQTKNYEEGDEIYTLGDAALSVYVVVSGRVRFSIGVGNRASAAQSIMEAGETFGWAALTGEEPRRVATASCLEDTTVLTIDGTALTRYFETDTASGYAVMRQLADRISRDLLAALTT